MVFQIEITQEELRRIQAARLDLTRLVKSIIASLPESVEEIQDTRNEQEQSERDPVRVARVKSIRGKFAHLSSPSNYASEELHRQRQADKEREEQLGTRAQP